MMIRQIEGRNDVESGLLEKLSHFRDLTNCYKHRSGFYYYTDGIAYLAKHTKAYWLLDTIASYQPTIKEALIQRWLFTAYDEGIGVLECFDEDWRLILRQTIERVDFPLYGIDILVVRELLLLPSEYEAMGEGAS